MKKVIPLFLSPYSLSSCAQLLEALAVMPLAPILGFLTQVLVDSAKLQHSVKQIQQVYLGSYLMNLLIYHELPKRKINDIV